MANYRMTTYPPTQIKTDDGIINILQLTDLHLYLDHRKETAGINNYQSFIACLEQALNEDIRCDLILLSGDLVNEVKPEIYQQIYRILQNTGIAFACIVGNHDVTDELGKIYLMLSVSLWHITPTLCCYRGIVSKLTTGACF